ncbi:MAG: PEP-CTERM-box response regulator transcription factor [Geminicoccaceae bacterium]
MTPNLSKVLILEDDPGLRKQLRWSLEGYQVLQTDEREEAIAMLRAQQPAMVLLDLGLPPDAEGVSEGFAALEAILRLAPATKVIIMTGQDDHAHAVRAIGMGAYDFHQKPVDPDILSLLVQRAVHLVGLELDNERLLAAEACDRLPGIVGDSPSMQQVARMVEKVAPADVSVVLQGESCTGKELVARALHQLSPRKGKAFVAINCAAIPGTLLEAELFGYEKGAFTGAVKQTPGKIEMATGGTLFLDEIGDLPLDLQVKLLRFLQERVVERIGGRKEIPVDVRVICATHRDLPALVSRNEFREDLYYRLAEVVIEIPALRERAGDPVLLAHHLLHTYNQQLNRRLSGFTEDALAAIDGYPWPGNVRELQNKLKRAVIMAESKRITAADLDLDEGALESEPLNLKQVREAAEAAALRRALAQTRGNISKAARLLGVSRPTLYDLMRVHSMRV